MKIICLKGGLGNQMFEYCRYRKLRESGVNAYLYYDKRRLKQHLKRTIKAGFAQRRKTLKNCLLNGGFLREAIVYAFNKLNIDENIRGEKLSIETFGQLSEALLEFESREKCNQ